LLTRSKGKISYKIVAGLINNNDYAFVKEKIELVIIQSDCTTSLKCNGTLDKLLFEKKVLNLETQKNKQQQNDDQETTTEAAISFETTQQRRSLENERRTRCLHELSVPTVEP